MARAPAALIVVDVQEAFDDPSWGSRNNPGAETNVGRLLDGWRAAGHRIVHVRHHNVQPGRRFSTDSPGFAIKAEARPLPGEVLLTKTVNSAFIGTDLERLLRDAGIEELVVCGFTTDHCVSTTIRMAANLGFATVLATDATATFERIGPDGRHWTAEQMHDSAVASLHGEFATVQTTADILGAIRRVATRK